MTITIGSGILTILACICFALAALNVPLPRVQLGWLGMFFLSLGMIFR